MKLELLLAETSSLADEQLLLAQEMGRAIPLRVSASL